MQTASAQTGGLLVSVLSSVNNHPIENAVVTISYTGNPNNIIEQVRTNSSGQTELLSLSAPPLEYSMEPGIEQPYSEYTLNVTAEGFEPFDVSGTEVLPNNNSVQEIHLDPITPTGHGTNLVIPAHTLYGNYPPKIAEAEIKPLDESGEIVLSRVVIPEYIVVHDGAPTDSSAQNHYVLYRDYIKNVASSEIYATWPTSTITANVLAIMSFTLNRVYTEWYRNKGFNFTITSSTAFDHKWINGRNIFDTISLVVDEIFDQYLARPDVKQPILTQYCDGRRSTCPNWMTA
ncbi:MAG: carboxypeptidase regulatory-like domain-containing protein [Lachnospiraceae bacterium]|nr:carboxypeptidase regulatory-like domain-containing protein [Lachnospiraceae bacterium]